MKIIDGRALAEKIKDGIVKEILGKEYFKKPEEEACACGHDHGHEHGKEEAERKSEIILNCQRPNLAIILVGNREDSALYVSLKEKEAKKVGIDTHIYKCPEDITEPEILEMIDYLNQDDLIDGILIQLPLPKALDTDRIIAAIDPGKDVDGFHPDNLKLLSEHCVRGGLLPPVFEVVLEMLESIGCGLEGKKVAVLANSEIFGVSLVRVLECKGARAEAVYGNDKDLRKVTSESDILISAVGKPKFIKKDMIKKDAVIIDIGISKEKGAVCGDADFEDLEKKAGFITPVPGGVGPVTIAMTFRNTLKLFKKRHGKA